MEKIRRKQDVREILATMKKYVEPDFDKDRCSPTLVGYSGQYWEQGAGRRDKIWYNHDKECFEYNFYENSGGWHNLNDTELTEDEAIETVYDDRKYYNRGIDDFENKLNPDWRIGGVK